MFLVGGPEARALGAANIVHPVGERIQLHQRAGIPPRHARGIGGHEANAGRLVRIGVVRLPHPGIDHGGAAQQNPREFLPHGFGGIAGRLCQIQVGARSPGNARLDQGDECREAQQRHGGIGAPDPALKLVERGLRNRPILRYQHHQRRIGNLLECHHHLPVAEQAGGAQVALRGGACRQQGGMRRAENLAQRLLPIPAAGNHGAFRQQQNRGGFHRVEVDRPQPGGKQQRIQGYHGNAGEAPILPPDRPRQLDAPFPRGAPQHGGADEHLLPPGLVYAEMLSVRKRNRRPVRHTGPGQNPVGIRHRNLENAEPLLRRHRFQVVFNGGHARGTAARQQGLPRLRQGMQPFHSLDDAQQVLLQCLDSGKHPRPGLPFRSAMRLGDLMLGGEPAQNAKHNQHRKRQGQLHQLNTAQAPLSPRRSRERPCEASPP